MDHFLVWNNPQKRARTCRCFILNTSDVRCSSPRPCTAPGSSVALCAAGCVARRGKEKAYQIAIFIPACMSRSQMRTTLCKKSCPAMSSSRLSRKLRRRGKGRTGHKRTACAAGERTESLAVPMVGHQLSNTPVCYPFHGLSQMHLPRIAQVPPRHPFKPGP